MSASELKSNTPAHLAEEVVLSVVIPTFKERGNVAELIKRLDRTLAGIGWEAVFVDDNSPDGTADAVKAIALRDPRIRCLRRVGRPDLPAPASRACCLRARLTSR